MASGAKLSKIRGQILCKCGWNSHEQQEWRNGECCTNHRTHLPERFFDTGILDVICGRRLGSGCSLDKFVTVNFCGDADAAVIAGFDAHYLALAAYVYTTRL